MVDVIVDVDDDDEEGEIIAFQHCDRLAMTKNGRGGTMISH